MTKLLMGALALTLLSVGVAYRFRSARKESPAPVPLTLPSGVDQQVSGYTFTRSDDERKIFTVHAARTLALKQGGTTVLEDVVVEVFARKGDRHDVLRTQRAEYDTASGDFSSPGKTEIELNAQPDLLPASGLHGPQPVYLETAGVSYRQQGSLLVSSELVRFKVGPASGSARGMKYATKDAWLEFDQDVRADWRPPAAQPATRLAATHLRYDKTTGRVTLAGPVELSRGASRIVAGSGTVTLDTRSRMTETALEGGVQASLVNGEGPGASLLTASADSVHGYFDPASGALRAAHAEVGVRAEFRRRNGAGKSQSAAEIEAQSADVTFAGRRAVPQKGTASGNARLTMASRPISTAGGPRPQASSTLLPRTASETKILTTPQIDFSFRPGGRSVREAKTIGQGELVLIPQDPRQGQREITAGQFLMAFDGKDRPESLSGTSGTRLVQQPPPGTPPGLGKQESSSERLWATFDPATEAIQTLEQTGNFSLTDVDRRASAERADYSPQGQTLTLTGHPLLWDAVTRIKAERFLLHLDNDTAEGTGRVEATHFEGQDAPPPAAGAKTDGAASGSDTAAASATTNVLADRVRAERRDQLVHYEGHVRAWHGADVIESSSLDYFGKQRRVSSGSSVLTSHLAPAAQVAGSSSTPRSSRHATRPLTIRADHLEFFDEGRKADYRGNVELQTESTTLRSDRMEVYFARGSTLGGSQVEHVVANGQVRVTQPQRRATGDRADYEAASGKIVMTGGAPSLYDEERGFTTGQSLTFFIHDDRLSVDGGEKSPTLSKRRISQ